MGDEKMGSAAGVATGGGTAGMRRMEAPLGVERVDGDFFCMSVSGRESWDGRPYAMIIDFKSESHSKL